MSCSFVCIRKLVDTSFCLCTYGHRHTSVCLKFNFFELSAIFMSFLYCLGWYCRSMCMVRLSKCFLIVLKSTGIQLNTNFSWRATLLIIWKKFYHKLCKMKRSRLQGNQEDWLLSWYLNQLLNYLWNIIWRSSNKKRARYTYQSNI